MGEDGTKVSSLSSSTEERAGVRSRLPETAPAELARLLRRTTERWCDWLDAANHLHVHTGWHQAPIYFDPDVEKRDLAGVGLAQRHYSEMNDWTKAAWHHLHAQFAQRYEKSPKWLTVGQAMATQDTRQWTYHEVDTFIIYLWPLLKLHNWTYHDLLNVIRSLLTANRKGANVTMQPGNSGNQFRYPCEREQDFATYCTTVLGLRKVGRGKTTTSRPPPGYDVASALFRPAP